MKKTLSILILCVSIFTLFSMIANAAEITYTPSDYYAVVSEINEKYDVRISIEQFADNVTKTPAELYAELEKLVLRSKANEAKKAAILAFDDDMALSTAKNLTRQTYHEELTKTSSVDSVFDIDTMKAIRDRICEVAQDVDFLVHRRKLVKYKLRENPLPFRFESVVSGDALHVAEKLLAFEA